MRSILTKNIRAMLAGLVLLVACSSSAFAVDNCGGVYSPGNPYPCCTSTTGSGANCTWFAWSVAKGAWRASLPKWGNAKDWATNARNSGYPVSSRPGAYTIGVSSTLSTYGHVAWILKISGDQVYVREMLCGGNGWAERWRSISTFNRGFIYPKRGSQRPIVSGISPYSPWSSSANQWIRLSGLSLYAPLIVDLTTPSGSTYTVQGSQIRYVYNSVSVYVTLNSRGSWSLRAVSSNGQRSEPLYFRVK